MLILDGKHLSSGDHFEISEVEKISEKQWETVCLNIR